MKTLGHWFIITVICQKLNSDCNKTNWAASILVMKNKRRQFLPQPKCDPKMISFWLSLYMFYSNLKELERNKQVKSTQTWPICSSYMTLNVPGWGFMSLTQIITKVMSGFISSTYQPRTRQSDMIDNPIKSYEMNKNQTRTSQKKVSY